jgi:smad nuclear-interacting protein 1
LLFNMRSRSRSRERLPRSDVAPKRDRRELEPPPTHAGSGSYTVGGGSSGGGGGGACFGCGKPGHARRDCPGASSNAGSGGAASGAGAPASAPPAAPSFALSGALAADAAARSVGAAGGADGGGGGRGGVLKWSEPVDARAPSFRWHLHVFRGEERVDEPVYIHRRSATLFGRDRAVADVPCDHPSCSGQHAVIQFRLVAVAPAGDGLLVAGDAPARTVKPYLLDLESTNGTFLNGRRVEPARYIELRPRDVLRMGTSSREFVLLYDEMAKDAR